MPLIVPFAGVSDPSGVNLLRLAEFMGVNCVRVPIDKILSGLPQVPPNSNNSCLAINPAAVKAFGGERAFTQELADRITAVFKFVLVHNLNPDPFSENVVRVLSANQYVSIRQTRFGSQYHISKNARQICGAFAGLSFGCSNSYVDRVINIGHASRTFSPLISVEDSPLLATIRRGNAQVFFLATSSIADLGAEIGDEKAAAPFFSQLLPPAMLLRHMFAGECWQPHEHHATLIIDDPPLWPSYGYLNYERLLHAMDSDNFHSSIAFIPHNYRRDSPEVVRLFRARPDRFSLCFHGNDHTRAELADTDGPRLNNLLNTAISRMERHRATTSLKCEKVMVFPQGVFSREAMYALRSHNFLATVNTELRPQGSQSRIALEDFIQPALLNYGFPLFIRNSVDRCTPENLAFNIFFGRPIFIAAHHDTFKDVEPLRALVDQINSLSPQVHWSNLQTAINNSYLTRRLADGTREICTYASVGSIENQSAGALRFAIELNDTGPAQTEKVLLNGECALDTVVDKNDRRIVMLIPPGKRCSFDALDGESNLTPHAEGVAKTIKAFCRRRLSEFRDNYLSKNPLILLTAKSLQRHLQSLRQPELNSR